MRHLVLPVVLTALTGPAALAAPSAPAAPQQATESTECTCTCAACQAKHGAAAQAAAAERAAAERVLEVLETELSEVDALVAEEPVEAVLVDVTEAVEVMAVEPAAEPIRIQLPTAAPAPAQPVSPQDRGYLGVALGEDTDGVAITAIMDGSPAESAGVQAGDVLFNVAGSSVLDMDGVRAALEGHAAGEAITIGVMRDGKPVRMRLTLGDRTVLGTSALPAVAELVEVVPGLDRPDPTQWRVRVEAAPEPPADPRAEGPVAVDPLMQGELPRGYEEIVVRRERRPAPGDGAAEARALEARIVALEAELDRLTAKLAAIQSELERRNPR